MEILDCRNMVGREAVNFIVRKYNALSPGKKLQAHVTNYEMELRGGLLERGLRHREERAEDGSWQITVERGLTTAQGSIPGVHHVIANADGDVWTCQRAPLAARVNVNTKRAEVVSSVLRKGSHLASDAAGNRIIIPDPIAGELVALRASDLKVEYRWKVAGHPQFAAISEDGIVCTTGDSSLTIVRPVAGDFETQIVRVGAGPHDPVIGSDGAHIFVPCMLEHDLVKVRLSDGQIMGRFSIGHGLAHTASDPKTKRIYVTNSWNGTVSAVSEDGIILAHADSGGWAHSIDITPDGRWVWVANFLDDTVAVFDATTLQRKALLNTDPYPHGLNISPDGKRAVVTGYASSHVKVFDAVKWEELAHIEVGYGPSHTAFIPGSSMAAIACSVDDHIACIDLEAGRVTDKVRLGPALN
jgi:YVTN family beta-propeller protein